MMGSLFALPAQPHDVIFSATPRTGPLFRYSVAGVPSRDAPPLSACLTASMIFWSEGSMRNPFLAITSLFTNTVNSPGFPCCNSASIPSSVFKRSATRTACGRVELHPMQYRITIESIRVSSFTPRRMDSLSVFASL